MFKSKKLWITVLSLVAVLLVLSQFYTIDVQATSNGYFFTVTVRNKILVKGYADITDSLHVHGNLIVDGSSSVTGANFTGDSLGSRLVVKDSLHVYNNATVNGTFTEYGAATFGSTVNFLSGVTADTNAFATTVQHDTVAVSGATASDLYLVTPRGGAATSNDVLGVEATSTGFIVHRPASGTSGLKYCWFRFKH